MFDRFTLLPTEAVTLDPAVLFGIASIASAVIPPLAAVAVAYLRRRRR